MPAILQNLTFDGLLTAASTLRRGAVMLLLGHSDTGKSTLARALVAGRSPRLRHPVDGDSEGLGDELIATDLIGLVDTDVGQGSLAPPCAIGAAIVDGGVSSTVGMWFAGDVTPVRHIRDICDGSVRLLERLRRHNPGLIIVDTCGLVGGKIGLVLKQRLIRVIGPDVIVAFERSNELDPILTPFTRSKTWSTPIWKCVPSTEVGRKTPRFRRRYRAERLAAALERARSVTFPLESRPTVDDVVGLVAGLVDSDGFCLGIGVVEAVDEGKVVVNTAVVDVEKVVAVKLGELRVVAPGRAGSLPQ